MAGSKSASKKKVISPANARSTRRRGKVLSDSLLLDSCLAHTQDLAFLSEPSLRILKKQRRHVTKAATLDPQTLEQLWSSLIIDAIHTLKIRDRREKASNSALRNMAHVRKSGPQNVYGIPELKAYFESFSDFESVLYGAMASYRDHVAHVIRVWLIGVYLLTEYQGGNLKHLNLGFPFKESAEESKVSDEPFHSDELWAMWTLVALCHDLGYPLERTHRVSEKIDRMLSHFGGVTTSKYSYSFQIQNQAINELTLKLVSARVELAHTLEGEAQRYRTRVQSKFYNKFAHSFESLRHGIISCLVLMKTLVYFKESDFNPDGGLFFEDARQFHIRAAILRAIAAHTCQDIYHLRTNTLQFLLIICDELQEWGRPTFGEMKLSGQASVDDAAVRVLQCNLGEDRFSASFKYKKPQTSDATRMVKGRFRAFHKLMRAAIDDSDRKMDFDWEIRFKDHWYEYSYRGRNKAFEEMEYKHDGTVEDLYG